MIGNGEKTASSVPIINEMIISLPGGAHHSKFYHRRDR